MSSKEEETRPGGVSASFSSHEPPQSASTPASRKSRSRTSSRPDSGRKKSRSSRSGKRKSKKNRPTDTCPEPSGLSKECDDPTNRAPRDTERRKSFVAELFLRLAGRRRRLPPAICDCRSKGDLSLEHAGGVQPPPSEGQPEVGLGEHNIDDSVSPAWEGIPMAILGIQELIRKKRRGEELTPEEIHWFCEEVASGNVHESQLGAMLMAMCIQGMSDAETLELTKGIIETGEQLRWEEEWGPTVDKHSTGGVGDKVSIVLAPALATFDIKVPMLSGRGLGFTGGTLDKLESIPNFKAQCSNEELYKALEDAGCFIAGATNSIAPVDKLLYSIRDVTATVDCKPLIISSIISKKVAGGTKILVMDIKVGIAAFFRNVEEGRSLGESLIKISKELGVTTRVMLTDMETPIGRAVGNALEVEEAVECLKGAGAPDLMELVCTAGGLLLETRKVVSSLDEGKKAIERVIKDGSALQRFHDMLIAQGVSHEDVENLCSGYYSKVLPYVPQSQITPMRVKKAGTITNIDALDIGSVSWRLGAGRVMRDQMIDYRVGIWLTHVMGDVVEVGDVWAEVHHAGANLPEELEKQIEGAITIEPGRREMKKSRILDII